MCGIGGFYLRRNVTGIAREKILDAFTSALDSRGGDATGIAAFTDMGLSNFEKASCNAAKFNAGRNLIDPNTRTLLVHTRLATQGHPEFPKNNHPVVNGNIFVTHNGHIANDSDLWHEIGWQYRTADVDSEVIPGIVQSKGWENFVPALEELSGSMAIAMVNADHPMELVLAKGEYSPLFVAITDKIIMWGSTPESVKQAWAAGIGTPPKNLRSLYEGDYLHVKEGIIEEGRFKVKWDNRWWKYNTGGGTVCHTGTGSKGSGKNGTGKSMVTVISPKGVTHRVVDPNEKGRVNFASRYDLQAWGMSEEDIDQYVRDLKADHDELRAEADKMLNDDELWWEDPNKLIHFNSLWDRIREIKDEIEELAWAEFEHSFEDRDLTEEDEDDDASGEALTMIQCPSCLGTYSLDEMSDEGDELYCLDCWGYWKDSIGEGRSTRSKATGLLDVDGEEIPGY